MSRLSVAYRNSVFRSAQQLIGKRKIIRFHKAGPIEDVENFLHLLKPVAISKPLIRVGGDADGGYLVPDLLGGISTCFSPGVSTTADFELDLAKRGIKSYMADYSVDAPPFANPNFVFEKKFLGSSNGEIYMRLGDWVARNAPENSNNLILQMDIEGAEYPVLLDVSEETLARFQIMVVEFHNFDMAFEANGLVLLKAVFDKILRHFSVVHIHPNNYEPPQKHNGLDIHPVLEFTFLRKDLVEKDARKLTFPHPLDRRNIGEKADVVVPQYWW